MLQSMRKLIRHHRALSRDRSRLPRVDIRLQHDGTPRATQSRQVEAGTVLWSPSASRVASSRMLEFSRVASEKSGRDLTRWADLHAWSISELGQFWEAVSEFCGFKWIDRGHGPAYEPPPGARRMMHARWFEAAKMNFAQNLLPPPTDEQVLVSVSESPDLGPRKLTGRELHRLVARYARAIRDAGVRKGDRVAGVMTNSQEAIVCMLATTAVGAVWSSCSPDFGATGVCDRLGQISPAIVFFSLGYLYGGRWHDCRQLAVDVLGRLPGSPKGVGVPYWPDQGGGGGDPDRLSPSDLPSPLVPLDEFLGGSGRGAGHEAGSEGMIAFEPTSFDHPVFIMFSSGTTGLPKCMVHGAGGTLLHQKKELELHCDLKQGDRLLYFSTLGWMMWNWSAATLSVRGASLVTYDGSPGYPDLAGLWRVVAREGITHFGASPKYFGVCRQRGVAPAVDCLPDGGLDKLRAVLSTGSPLLPEHFQWVYESVKPDVHLASISGGTDILGCFALGNPTLPVRAGHLQCLGLGMDVCAYRMGALGSAVSGAGGGTGDATRVRSRKAAPGEMGELVCRTPFPSMPVFFWGDSSGAKYRSAYFETFQDMDEEVWAHGDYIKVMEDGSVVISGRSDAVLNPAGVRIGTSEIYRQVEEVPGVEDSVAVGLRVEGDVKVVLFVKLTQPALGRHTADAGGGARDKFAVPEDVKNGIKAIIRQNLTARHVPAKILRVKDVPYTRSGKKVEVAVTRAIHAEHIENVSALANPACLDQFREAGEMLRGEVRSHL